MLSAVPSFRTTRRIRTSRLAEWRSSLSRSPWAKFDGNYSSIPWKQSFRARRNAAGSSMIRE